MTFRISTGLRNKLLGINTNKVSNPDFTSDATGWTASTATLTGGVTYDSRVGVLQVDTAAGYGYQEVTVRPGTTYKFSFVYQNGGTGNAIVSLGTTQGGTDIYTSGNLTTTSWTTIGEGTDDTTDAIYFTAGASTTSVFIKLECSDTNPQYFDDVKIVSQSRSVQDIFRTGQLKFYQSPTGVQPTLADDATTGHTLLCTIDAGAGDGTGVTFADAVAGVISKTSGETWSGVCVATGTAHWMRLITQSDTGVSSTTEERIDFSVGVTGAQVNMTSTAFASGATQTITTCALTMPDD